MATKIKSVIFDMDGVLIEAKDWHYQALNKALTLFGMEISHYDHIVTYDGLPTRKKLEMLSKERGLPPTLHKFLNELKQKYTMEIIATCCHPTFTQQYALKRLQNEGFRLAVCSNSIRATIELMMQRAGLISYLDFFLSAEDVTKGKPDPEIYIKAIKKMDLTPFECLIIEDNPNGIAAARASNAFVMEVSSVADVNFDKIKEAIKRFEESLIC